MTLEKRKVEQNCTMEWSFSTRKEYSDPFNQLDVFCIFTNPNGVERTVPAFWASDGTWHLRYSSYELGLHHYYIMCSDKSDTQLNGKEGILEVIPYTGQNLLLRHGPLKISKDRRYLEHADNTPFFWLGDTWWMCLTSRLTSDGFKKLTADRVSKGFTVIQLVAGLYPDMAPLDERGANENGLPWNKSFTQINPAFFDLADKKINYLVQNGLVPCIFGSWGFFLDFFGEKALRKHWKNLVARYGSFPVIWCMAGEATMPYYLSPTHKKPEKRLKDYWLKSCAGWTRLTEYLRSIDPYHHPITIHPSVPPVTLQGARYQIEDPLLIDVDMLQTGHKGMASVAITIESIMDSYTKELTMPIIVGEVCYEGIFGKNWENVQRILFWACMLNGGSGYTYGANGIWQFNTKKTPFGSSPHGQSYGDICWEDAAKLPGSKQVSLGKQLLERYPWWRFKPYPDWVEPKWSKENYIESYAAGIPREIRVIYIPLSFIISGLRKVKGIEPNTKYRAFYFDPRTGKEYDVGDVKPDKNREWQPPKPPIAQDWVLVMEKARKLSHA